jgi:hypothetical protein
MKRREFLKSAVAATVTPATCFVMPESPIPDRHISNLKVRIEWSNEHFNPDFLPSLGCTEITPDGGVMNMSYACYTNHAGRECGYGIMATCDHPGCDAVIDRGYDYLCGQPDHIGTGGGVGCLGYFCQKHRGFVGEIKDSEDRECVSLCDACKADPAVLAMLVDEDEEC